MRLDRRLVAIRPRKDWEALDLGLRMGRTWWTAMAKPLALVIVPFWLLMGLLVPPNWGWLLFFLVWWLKPLWERIPLYVLSRATFGQIPTTGETLAALKTLWHPKLLAMLTLFRLSPNRHVNLPVILLEGQAGAEQRRRVSVMNAPIWGFNLLVMSMFMLCEWVVLFLGFYLIAQFLLPEDLLVPAFMLPGQAGSLFDSGVYIAAIIALEPFFVAVGFSLYLNRRTVLECWDIELGFKSMVERVKTQKLIRSALLPLLFLMPGLFSQQSLLAQEATPDPAEVIQEVLADPVFGRVEEETRWMGRFRDSGQTRDSSSGLSGLFQVLFIALKYLFWLLGLSLLAFVIYLVVKPLMAKRWQSRPKLGVIPEAEEVVKEAPPPEALPGDVVAAAQLTWSKGEFRRAMSLLYRGALRELGRLPQVTIDETATEEECLRLVRRKVKGDALTFFTDLTRVWQQMAYAHRTPDQDTFHELCRRWQFPSVGGGEKPS